MTDHLSLPVLNALADGELSAEQLAGANEHLSGCSSCTSRALFQSLLKSTTARAGQRYTPPQHLQERLARLASQEASQPEAPTFRTARVAKPVLTPRFGLLGWAAAVLLIASVSTVLVQRGMQRSAIATGIAADERTALITEAFDQHIAVLAASTAPQVLSTDRHTVKPWFQGKLPFSFNLPEKLPADTTLDGANLTYLNNQPVAQLFYSIGRHRVSVFVRERTGAKAANETLADHSGFHVIMTSTADLEVVAVSDVDPTRLSQLVSMFEQSQAGAHKETK